MTDASDPLTESVAEPTARPATPSERNQAGHPLGVYRADGGQPDDEVAQPEPDQGSTTAEETGEGDDDGSRDLSTTLEWAGLLVLGLLAVIATFRFYLAASTAIGRLVSAEYEPLFQAGFNLVVLLLAITGISLLARRLVLER